MRKKFYAPGMFLTIILILTVTLLGCGVAKNQQQSNAEKYPNGPVTVLVPFAAGSAVDVTARTLGQILEKELGQPFNIENMTAGSGAEALKTMMTQPANGQVMLIHTSTFNFLMAGKEVPYTLNDITPLARLAGEPIAFFVREDSPYKTMADLVKAAKKKPGSINIAGTGVQSIMQQVEIQVEQATGAKMNYVPYSGGSKIVTAVLGGHVDVGVSAVSNALAQVESGKMRYLGIAADNKIEGINAPTFKDQGINVSQSVWRGVFMRAGTPKARLDIMENAISKAMQDPTWKSFVKKNNQVLPYMGSDEFRKSISNEVDATAKFLNQVPAK